MVDITCSWLGKPEVRPRWRDRDIWYWPKSCIRWWKSPRPHPRPYWRNRLRWLGWWLLLGLWLRLKKYQKRGNLKTKNLKKIKQNGY